MVGAALEPHWCSLVGTVIPWIGFRKMAVQFRCGCTRKVNAFTVGWLGRDFVHAAVPTPHTVEETE